VDSALVTDSYVKETARRRWGIEVHRLGREWHSLCPFCGTGTDRFWINPHAHFQCRQCNTQGWLDDDQVEIDPETYLELQMKASAEEAVRQADIQRRLKELRTQAEQDAYLLGRDDERRLQAKIYFNSQGISDYCIKKYGLGFMPDHSIAHNGGYLRLPAYTIPIREPVNWEIVNYQFRLVDPPEGVGRYLQTYGIPSAAFYAEQTPEGFEEAICVEGAKKSIVVYDRIEARLQVVGLPGCNPGKEVLGEIKKLGLRKLWLILDPGCEVQEEKIKSFLAGVNVKTVHVPGKVDDLWLGGMKLSEFRSYLKQAR
jgi:hypothetical protein